MPTFMSFMPPFMPRLLTRVPPLLSDLVSCDRGRRRLPVRHTALPEAMPERPSAAVQGEPAEGGGFWLHAATSAKADAIISGLANFANILS